MQKSYADCAIHIVCIFGLTGEVFSQTHVVRHFMRNPVNIQEIIDLVKKQEPEREDLIIALNNSKGGHWENKAYYRFVDSKNANQIGSEWQFYDNIVLEHDSLGTIIIDYLKDNRIGGIEFMIYLD